VLPVPLFNLMVYFKVLVSNITRLLRPWLQKVVILTPPLPQKNVMSSIAPFFDLGVDFKVFVNNIMRVLRPWLQNVVILTLKKKDATSSTTFQFGG
jgi:hypothetical protein